MEESFGSPFAGHYFAHHLIITIFFSDLLDCCFGLNSLLEWRAIWTLAVLDQPD